MLLNHYIRVEDPMSAEMRMFTESFIDEIHTIVACQHLKGKREFTRQKRIKI